MIEPQKLPNLQKISQKHFLFILLAHHCVPYLMETESQDMTPTTVMEKLTRLLMDVMPQKNVLTDTPSNE